MYGAAYEKGKFHAVHEGRHGYRGAGRSQELSLCGYGDRPALDGFELRVPVGTVHGLLGPNGAGKTTALRIMATLLDLDEGEVRVAGYDAAKQGRQVRRHIGLVGQYAAVDEELSGMQNLAMLGR